MFVFGFGDYLIRKMYTFGECQVSIGPNWNDMFG